QITGVYGIYPRPYRLFDVDDLMLNTLGGVVGYYITPAIVFLFPTRQEIEEKVSLEASRVPFLRRVFAYVIDYNLIAIVIRISIFFMDLNKYTLNLLVALVLAFIY